MGRPDRSWSPSSASSSCRLSLCGIAAFNDKALLSFPPQQLSLRWFDNALSLSRFPDRLSQRPDRDAVRPRSSRSSSARPSPSSSTAMTSAPSNSSKACCSRRWWCRISRSGSAFSSSAAQIGLTRGFRRSRRLPCDPGAAVRAAQRLHFAAQSRSAARACRREPWRSAGARAFATVTLPLLTPGLCQRLAVRRDPVLQRIHGLAVRDGATHPDAAGRDV